MSFTESVRVVWRREPEAVIAGGPGPGGGSNLLTFTAGSDRVTMRGEGEPSGSLMLLRHGATRCK